MKRKALALAIILALSFSAIVGSLSFNLATADFAIYFHFPLDPITTLPMIVVYSPVQNQFYNHVWLNFSIVKPESWFGDFGFNNTETFVNITSVYYIVDGSGRQNILFHDIDSLFEISYSPTLTLTFSEALSLKAGAHTVKVGLEATSYYWLGGYNWSNSHGSVELRTDTETLNFNKALFIEVHLPANKTFDTSSVPLNFTVEEPVSQVKYSLDFQENVTVSGNSTLTGLSNGEHKVTVYARDYAGNVGSSETTAFTVAKPEPFPTLLVAATFVIVVAVVIVAALVYWKKSKLEPERS